MNQVIKWLNKQSKDPNSSFSSTRLHLLTDLYSLIHKTDQFEMGQVSIVVPSYVQIGIN